MYIRTVDMIDIISANGTPVRNLQTMLRAINFFENILPEVIVDGIFDSITKEAVVNFQKRFNLTPTGEVDIITFEKIVEEYKKTLEPPDASDKENEEIPDKTYSYK